MGWDGLPPPDQDQWGHVLRRETKHHVAMRPLPRSLDPLSDETLTGYILRLAHRAGTSPGAVAVRTGLTGERKENVFFRVPIRLLHNLEPEQLQTFARTTRLVPGEVSRLLTSSLTDRYGPLNGRFTPRSSAARMVNSNSWLLTRATRYCPQCLTGDGSEIQRRHGGAWRLSWRLPPVFACPRHRRLLRTDCPACRQPVHAVEMNSIIARPWDEDLHPTQCRTTIAPRTVGRLQLYLWRTALGTSRDWPQDCPRSADAGTSPRPPATAPEAPRPHRPGRDPERRLAGPRRRLLRRSEGPARPRIPLLACGSLLRRDPGAREGP